uniref:uncharacterized protein isoform X2 n=1 Tax=Myxine glutinosa TaxID=7769 RepID=UPI00358DE4F7
MVDASVCFPQWANALWLLFVLVLAGCLMSKHLFFVKMFAVPAKKPLTVVDWLSSFLYTPPVKEESFFNWFWTTKNFWQCANCWSFVYYLFLLVVIVCFLRWLWPRLANLKFSTRLCYSITQVLMSLLGSFALTWIFFHKLFPLPPKEVTFWDRMYSIFSTPPEKTFFNWVYITDGQKSTLTFSQDPSLCFFWFVILPQKILDFLLFLLWQKLQDNWHEEKCKSHDCVPKLPSPKPNQDKGIADVHNEVMEIVRSAHSIQSEDSGNVLQMTTAQGFPDQEQHLMPSIADVLNEVVEIVCSAHSIQSEDSGNVLQMTTAQVFSDQEQHLMPSIADVHNEVMEIVRSAHSIQSEDSGNVLQMTTAQGFSDQEQHLMPSHSLLPLRDEPQEVKPKLKKLKSTRQDCPWSFKDNKLGSQILKVKQEFKNGGVTVSVEIVGDTDFVDLHFKTGVFQNASVKDERLSFIVRLGFCPWMYVYGEAPSVKFLTNSNEEIHFTHLFLMEKMLKTFVLSRWKRVNPLHHPKIHLRIHGVKSLLAGAKR